MRMYEAHTPANSIRAVEVERITDGAVYINGKRKARLTKYTSFHETWDQAKARLIDFREGEVVGLRRRLEYANGQLGNVKGLKNPEEN